MKSERQAEKKKQQLRMLRSMEPTGNAAALLNRRRARQKKHLLCLAAATVLLSAAAGLSDSGILTEGSRLLRNAAGEGSYVVSLIASVEGEGEVETDVTVEEQELTGEALELLFEAAQEELQTAMLAENVSADSITSDLTLPSQTQDGLVQAQWAFDDYQVLDTEGAIRDNVPEEGETVEVTLTMTYRDRTAETVFSIRVYPRAADSEQTLEQALEEAVAGADEQTASDASLILPDEVDGKAVSWREPAARLWLEILLLGLCAGAIMYYEDQESLKRSMERRERQMMADYAGIVNKLALLLGAGMSVSGAWERIVRNYTAQQSDPASSDRRSRSQNAEMRIAYEEMKVTYAQIQEGAGELKAYEAFGRRCALRPYLKLSAILTQNLRLGTSGLTQQLSAEAQEAFEQRKALARQKGEEAGTKLTVPMMMLLVVVMAIVVIPGFISI